MKYQKEKIKKKILLKISSKKKGINLTKVVKDLYAGKL